MQSRYVLHFTPLHTSLRWHLKAVKLVGPKPTKSPPLVFFLQAYKSWCYMFSEFWIGTLLSKTGQWLEHNLRVNYITAATKRHMGLTDSWHDMMRGKIVDKSLECNPIRLSWDRLAHVDTSKLVWLDLLPLSSTQQPELTYLDFPVGKYEKITLLSRNRS